MLKNFQTIMVRRLDKAMSWIRSVPSRGGWSLTLGRKLFITFVCMAAAVGICGATGLIYFARIATSVSIVSEITSPLLIESMALIDNADDMRSAVLDGASHTDASDDPLPALRKLDAEGREHVTRLKALSARAGMWSRFEPVEQLQNDFVATLENIVKARNPKLMADRALSSSYAQVNGKARSADADLGILAQKFKNQLSENEALVNAQIAGGTATANGLSELFFRSVRSRAGLQDTYDLAHAAARVYDLAQSVMSADGELNLGFLEVEARNIFTTITPMRRRVAASVEGHEELPLWRKIDASLNALQTALSGLDGLAVKKRDSLTATARLTARLKKLREIQVRYMDVLTGVATAVRIDNATSMARSGTVIERGRVFIGAVVGFAALLGIGAALLLTRSITTPLNRLTKHVRSIGERGDLVEISDRSLVAARDELGDLSRAFNGMIAEVAQARRQLIASSEAEISKQVERLEAALTNMTQGLCMFDRHQRVIVANKRYAETFGIAHERVRPGTHMREILEERVKMGSYYGNRDTYVDRRLGAYSVAVPSDSSVELANGRTIHSVRRPMADGGWLATHEDITERKILDVQLEQNLQLLSERTSLLQGIIDGFPGGIGFFDRDLKVVVCNDRAKKILDLPEQFFANGPPPLEDILRFNAMRGEYGPGDIEEQVAAKLALAKDRATYHFERERPDGTVLDVRGMPVDNGGFVTIYMDITERYRSEAKIAHMARHDALTGLANRVMLDEQLEHILTRVARGEIVAIHLLDLDRFKTVNDTLGHPAGDKLLLIVADRLRALVRETDMIARMGGDEFVIVQIAISDAAYATTLARRVIDAVREPYDIDGHHVVIGASIGIAMGPVDGLHPEELMKNADLALYQAKADGRGSFCFFEPDMNVQMQARHALENDLRKALPAGEFALHYQPMLNLDSNEISGFEALIRWQHPKNGLMSPDRFLPLAEDTGFVIQLGEWTVREACATASNWPSHLRVAVNLSPSQFRHPGTPDLIAGALAASGLAPDRLELEINEMALWEDVGATLDILYGLRALGVRIAMDDFGTGNSSLNYLQSFPFDRIKIDRSFVKDITDKTGSLRIVRAVATLAQDLGMETTVEGVESPEQLAVVKSEGCTEVQGFLFSHAIPSDQIAQLLISERRDPKIPPSSAAA